MNSLGGNPGSREPDPSSTGSGPPGFDPGRITVGLLGAEIDQEKLEVIGTRHLTECRLEEIERRILAIEEMVWPLGR